MILTVKAWILNIASGKVGVKGQRKCIDGYQNVAVTQEQTWWEKPYIVKEPNIENSRLYSYANEWGGYSQIQPNMEINPNLFNEIREKIIVLAVRSCTYLISIIEKLRFKLQQMCHNGEENDPYIGCSLENKD